MTERPMFQVGDLVKTPAGGPFGDKAAIVIGQKGAGATTHTGSTVLQYEESDLRLLGRIAFTTPARAATDGNRYRQYVYEGVDGVTKAGAVCVRRLSETTDADELTAREHVFALLVADGVWNEKSI